MTRADSKRPGLDRGASLCAVVHRDDGRTAISTAPRPFRPGRGEMQIRARPWPRPAFKANSRIERRPLRGGSGGGVKAAEHPPGPSARCACLQGKPCGLSPPRDACRPSMPSNRLRRIGPASTPPRWTAHWRTRWHLLRQVAQMRAVLNAGGSCLSRHEGRFMDKPARHRYGASTPRLKTGTARCGRGALVCRRVVDLARVSGRAGAAFMRGYRAGHISFRSGSAQGVLVSL